MIFFPNFIHPETSTSAFCFLPVFRVVVILKKEYGYSKQKVITNISPWLLELDTLYFIAKIKNKNK